MFFFNHRDVFLMLKFKLKQHRDNPLMEKLKMGTKCNIA